MDETISLDSNVGKRLGKIKKSDSRALWFKGREIPLVAKISIGRDQSNSIIIDDKLVSRFHAEIQKIKEDYFIKDLNSSNGTFVNNTRIPDDKYVKLENKDIIRIGKSEVSLI